MKEISNLKIYNFPAWIDSSIFSSENSEIRTDLLFVGNIIKRKGVYFLINSLSTFLLENENIKLRIIGKKEDAKYYAKINDIVKK